MPISGPGSNAGLARSSVSAGAKGFPPRDGQYRRKAGTRRHSPGFTLLELLVVISIIAIASAGVSFALRDNGQMALEREGVRLAALLEAGRALSRTSGQTVHWRDTPQGFSFDGPNVGSLPRHWLNPDTGVQWDAGNKPRLVTLGPEPIIEAQTVTLVQEGRALRIATDGLRPFAVQAAP